MNKSELLNIPSLKATRAMLRMAKDDKPICETHKTYGGSYERRRFKHWLYIRCAVENDIIKIACFLADSLRERCSQSAYEIYVDRKARDYLTYATEKQKWLTACFYNLPKPVYAYYSREIFADRRTVNQMNSFFGTSFDAEHIIQSLTEFQQAVMEERLDRRHKKETDPWDEDLKQTRELPKGWTHWIDKVGIPEQFIFYEYTRKKYKLGYCSYCGQEVKVQPHHNEIGTCPHCHRKVVFKALGRFDRFTTADHFVHLIQKCRDGFMLREFTAWRRYTSKSYKTPEIRFAEHRRIIGTPDGALSRAYYYGSYKQVCYRWIAGNICSPRWMGNEAGRIYGKSFVCLDRTYLHNTGLNELYRKESKIDPELYLVKYNNQPIIEKLIKAGMWHLFDDFGKGDYHRVEIDYSQTSLIKMLQISQSELNRLRNADGGTEMLRWLQYEKLSGKSLSDETVNQMMEWNLMPADLSFATPYMSVPQIQHYLIRHMDEEKMTLREVLTTWRDYLSMAEKLGYNLNDEIIHRVRRLRYRHDLLVLKLQETDINVRADEIAALYPNAESILKSVKPLYSYADEEYTVIAPETIVEVLSEGRMLHHCVAEHERYWDRIERRESYILFLRKTSEVEIPFYTLEVEPDGTIRQQRSYFDKKGEDIEAAYDFLRKWQSAVKPRLNGEDLLLAKRSRELRVANFEQLSRDNVRINTGTLQGQRLVDVLMADLMVAA